jgi:hypothetical protein
MIDEKCAMVGRSWKRSYEDVDYEDEEYEC